MIKSLRVGSRGSLLARRQAEMTISRLVATLDDVEVTLRIISTKGDVRQDLQLRGHRSTGLFVKEIEEALIRGEVDLAVHSLKDVPSRLPDGLTIACVLERGDPRDALISIHRSLAGLPEGARVGTSSLRRTSQILHAFPTLRLKDIRGNVDTRIAKLDAGEYDAILLASCGLDRTGNSDRITERIDPAIVLPAACQGIVAVEARSGDEELLEMVCSLGDKSTFLQAQTERAFLDAIDGGCRVPVGCLSVFDGEDFEIEGMIGSVDGVEVVRRRLRGAVTERNVLARELASVLLAEGGARILKAVAK